MSTGLIIAIVVISLVCIGLSIGFGVYVMRKRAADKAAAEETQSADKVAADKVAADKAAADKAATEKAAADKAAADKVAAEKQKIRLQCVDMTFEPLKQELYKNNLLNAMRPQHKKKWMGEINKLMKKLEDPVCLCFEPLLTQNKEEIGKMNRQKIEECIAQKLDWSHFDESVAFAIADISSADTRNDLMDINYDHPELTPSDGFMKNVGVIAQCIYTKIKEDYPTPNDLLIEMQSMQNNNIVGRNRLKNIVRRYLQSCFVNQDMCTKKLMLDYLTKNKVMKDDINRFEILCKGDIPPGMIEPMPQAMPMPETKLVPQAMPMPEPQLVTKTTDVNSISPTKVEGFTDTSKFPTFSNYKPFMNQDGYIQLQPVGPRPDLTQLNNSIQGYSSFDFQNKAANYHYN